MERVQLNLERQLPELRDLEKKKIFTRKEISDIVKRRTAFETALIRKGSDDHDWLQYIEYEKKLEQLRKIRYNKMDMKGRPTVSDYSIARHILSLYSSAVTRRPGSMKLWQEYITHVMRNSNSSAEISRVLARALSLHPTRSSIWILAIRFEADGTGLQGKEGGIGGGNIDAARKLVMRALRFMKGAKREDALQVWLEWIRLEISFVERMRTRWEILGIADTIAGEANMQVDGHAKHDEGDVPLPDPTESEVAAITAEETEQLSKAANQVTSASQGGQAAILKGAIVKVVIQNALSAGPMDTSIYTAIVQLLRSLPTSLRPALLRHTHDTFTHHVLPSIQDDNQRALGLAILARSYIADLAERTKAGDTVEAIPVDSLLWLEGVEASIRYFRKAIRSNEGARPAVSKGLRSQFAIFLEETESLTEDEDMRQYLRGQLGRLEDL